LIGGSRRRVDKALMQPLGLARKYRTRFLCVITNGEDKIEVLPCEFVYGLRPVSRDVDTDLLHRCNGIWIETSRTRSCAEYLELISRDMSQQTLRHLAASRISSAEE